MRERQIINKDKMGETVKGHNERERVRETLSRVAQLFTQKKIRGTNVEGRWCIKVLCYRTLDSCLYADKCLCMLE